MSSSPSPSGTHAVVGEFLRRQREMYRGGETEPLLQLMAEDIVWHVPGTSPIAGDYRGRDAVLGYFLARRALAGGSIAITKHDEMHDAEVLVQLADGQATLGGVEAIWRTAGVYRVEHDKVAEAWLVPLDEQEFTSAWSRTRPTPFVYAQRVRPQDCAASEMLGHPRFLEFFEAAFVECWRKRFGPLAQTLGPERRLTVAAISVDYRAPVRVDDELRIEVAFDRITTRSIQVHYDGFVEDRRIAEGRSRYVCLDARSGDAVALPEAVREPGGLD
jgi:uncharacterized protein